MSDALALHADNGTRGRVDRRTLRAWSVSSLIDGQPIAVVRIVDTDDRSAAQYPLTVTQATQLRDWLDGWLPGRCDAETEFVPYDDPPFWLRCWRDAGHDGPHHADDGDHERDWDDE
ncbi:MAG: hypothetical protein KA249_12170 [Dermatophilaceae bacterium]|nr:hypothetical protein [Dermatophilaceae bacterium]